DLEVADVDDLVALHDEPVGPFDRYRHRAVDGPGHAVDRDVAGETKPAGRSRRCALAQVQGHDGVAASVDPPQQLRVRGAVARAQLVHLDLQVGRWGVVEFDLAVVDGHVDRARYADDPEGDGPHGRSSLDEGDRTFRHQPEPARRRVPLVRIGGGG